MGIFTFLSDRFIGRRFPIYQVTSFARSGETLLLRCLDAHPKISVLHQVRTSPSPAQRDTARHVRNTAPDYVRLSRDLVHALRVDPDGILLVKNGVWRNTRPYKGFVLARNPFSVLASLLSYEPDAALRKRLRRWAEGIDPSLLPLRDDMSSAEIATRLYARQMLAARDTGLPIVRYEELLRDPRRELERILRSLSLDWDDGVLKSHEKYKPGEIGHGRIDLSEPIRTSSDPVAIKLTEEHCRLVQDLAADVLRSYGYCVKDRHIDLLPLDRDA